MKKNVAILISQLAGGGAERVASNLSLFLPDKDLNKHIIVYDTKKIDYAYRGKLINLNIKSKANPIFKFLNFLRRIYLTNKNKEKYNIDVTISFLSSPNLINIFSKNDDKLIISVRNFISKSSSSLYGKFFQLSVKLYYRRADLVIAVSKLIKQDLINNYGLDEKKVKVIYNPYDIEEIERQSFKVIPDQYDNIFKKPTIITVGRLSKQKGQWHLIRAFKKVKEKIPNAQLVILGQGDLEIYLKEMVANLGLENDVHFLGFQKNPFKFIRRSTLYVFPSLYEGFPNALCEAMACGIPVISSDCKSGPREILAPNTDIYKEAMGIEYENYGILVPVCDGKMYSYTDILTREEQMLSNSIIQLLNNQKYLDKYSKKSKIRVKDFNKEQIMKEWEREILG